MGKKLDALLGRNFKTSKFKAVVNLAVSRLSVVRNRCEVRLSQSRSDTAELLKVGHHERALLRVDIVIKEQNMSDVFVMIEEYCRILIERVHLIETNRECPDELQEAISSLIFAASRCGDFPELQELRSIFASRFGKEFASRAVELRNNCGVNGKMIQKLSTRRPSHESKMLVLQEIASANGITLDLEEEPSASLKENLDLNHMGNHKQPQTNVTNFDKPKAGDQTPTRIEEIDQIELDDQTSGSFQARRRYHDVASAAQAAFESAAYAAEAARAAVELSRTGFHDNYSDGSISPPGQRNRSNSDVYSRAAAGELDSGKIHPIENSDSDSENDNLQQIQGAFRPEFAKQRLSKENRERSLSASREESVRGLNKVIKTSSKVPARTRTPDSAAFDESDDETGDEADKHVNLKSSLYVNKFPEAKQNNISADSESEVHSNRLNLERRPISVRARRGHKW